MKLLHLMSVGGLMATVCLAIPSYASTLVQEQLRGLRGAWVSVHVRSDIVDSRFGEDFRSVVEERLEAHGLSTNPDQDSWLLVGGNAEAVSCPNYEAVDPVYAVSIEIFLCEKVSILRSPGQDVPGGGAATWWKVIVFSAPRSELEMSIQETVEWLIGIFLGELESANRCDDSTTDGREIPPHDRRHERPGPE